MNTALDTIHLQRISQRFTGRLLQGYVRSKLNNDPVYDATAEQIITHPLPVLDVGCGIGLFAHYLHILGCDAMYLGIDLDAHKIQIAQRAARNHHEIRFEKASCEILPAWQGHVVILDTLHYLTAVTQQQLLRAAAARVAPGGVLVIRSVLRDTSWRFAITRLEEFLMHGIRWMRCRVQHYPGREELLAPLAEAELTIEIKPLWGRTPFNSYLIVARRAV